MWWMTGGLMAALAVALGAFGAHALEDALVEEPRLLEVWHTAGRYHMFHAVGLLAVAVHPRKPTVAGGLFVAGITLFCGSLYLMPILTLAVGGSWRWLGAVTPFGGVAFIAGWVCLAVWPRGGNQRGLTEG